ncbi:hypothetical protein EJ06DRAFT_455557, partial [Trichodelitschia bisporula]
FEPHSVVVETLPGAAAWWCPRDHLVIFDGFENDESGKRVLNTRTSKGLSISRKHCRKETVRFYLHWPGFQDALGKHKKFYETSMCRRGVCKNCVNRC